MMKIKLFNNLQGFFNLKTKSLGVVKIFKHDKKTVLITSIVLAIALTVIILYPKKQSLTYSIHKTNNGYGYTIQENNKILIKQNNICY